MLTIGLTGCEDEIKYRPLPEAVPLTMSINEKAFVMGEKLKVDISVNPDADGNEVVANEDFDIYFTAKSGTTDVSNVFEPFSSIVTFPKGEKQIQVDFPVKTSGLTGSTTMEFVAFARGYKMDNSSLGIKVSDYYRVDVSLQNNAENMVMEGETFVLVAKVDKASQIPIQVKITPKEDQKGYFQNLPEIITIPAGRKSVTSSPVTIVQDYQITGNLELVLNLEGEAEDHPTLSETITITMQDLESLADPNLYDMTKVYELPEQMFVSSGSKTNSWFTGKSYIEMVEKQTPHPNTALAAEKWKFLYATEFHHITGLFSADAASGHDYLKTPNGFTDANDNIPEQNLATVDNALCTNVTDEGILTLWARKASGGAPYRIAGYQTARVNNNTFRTNYIRLYPGMRIELKVRLGGVRTGFVPTIELKDPMGKAHLKPQTISILKNEKGTAITQTVTGETAGAKVSQTTSIPKVNDWNIYWLELIDDNTVNLGINGAKTLTVTSKDMQPWLFSKESTPFLSGHGYKGFYLLLRMAPSADLLNGTLPDGWDVNLDASGYEEKGPRMEVDWIRYYINDNYNITADEDVKKGNPDLY